MAKSSVAARRRRAERREQASRAAGPSAARAAAHKRLAELLPGNVMVYCKYFVAFH